MKTNPACPDSTSHETNAFDAYCEAHGHEPATSEEWEIVDADADREYWACEGH